MSKLELYNIYAGYEESKPVLKDISFFVEKGEFIVLLGQHRTVAKREKVW